MSTPEEIETARRNLVAEMRQMLRRKDLDGYPIDAQTAHDLVEVLGALGANHYQGRQVAASSGWKCGNCEATDFACTACGARVED